MKQKYAISRNDDNASITITEYSEVDKDIYAQLLSFHELMANRGVINRAVTGAKRRFMDIVTASSIISCIYTITVCFEKRNVKSARRKAPDERCAPPQPFFLGKIPIFE